MTTPVFANSGAIQPQQGIEIACCTIVGSFAALDAYVSGGQQGVQLEFRLYATVGALRTLVAKAGYAGPPSGALQNFGTVLQWVVIGDNKTESPTSAGGSQYDLVVYGVNAAGTPVSATLAGTNAYDPNASSSAAVAFPGTFASTTITTNIGCAQVADIGVNQSGLAACAFDLFVSCGAGSVEAIIQSYPIAGRDGLSGIAREVRLPIGTQYRLAVRNTGDSGSGNVAASLATYISGTAGGGAAFGLNGDVIGPSNANSIVNFNKLAVTTFENYGAIGNGIVDDTAAINAALAALATIGGGTIMMGAKTYLTTGFAIPPSTNGIAIVGQGNSSRFTTVSNSPCITAHQEGTLFQSFVVAGNGIGASQDGIRTWTGVSGVSNWLAINIICENLGGTGFYIYFPGPTLYHAPQLTSCTALNCNVGFVCGCEYSVFSACTSNGCTRGFEIDAGNVTWVDGNLSGCTTGIYQTGGGNDGHGIVDGVLINHCATAINIGTLGGLTNGMLYTNCDIYYGDILLVTTNGVQFRDCFIDVVNLFFDGSLGTVFSGCVWPQGNPNTIHNNFNGHTSKTRFDTDNIDLTGQYPGFIKTGTDQASWCYNLAGFLTVEDIVVAPAAPAAGFGVNVWTDFADHCLKAIGSSGDITILATP